MAVKQVFESTDGRTYPTAKAAEKRDAMVQATRRFEEAGRELVRCIGESAMTADGQPFNMRGSQKYWFVADSFSGLPQLIELWLWPHHAHVEIDHRERVIFRHDNGAGRGDYVDYPIDELYADERAATKAYIARCLEYIARCLERLAEQVENAKRKHGVK